MIPPNLRRFSRVAAALLAALSIRSVSLRADDETMGGTLILSQNTQYAGGTTITASLLTFPGSGVLNITSGIQVSSPSLVRDGIGTLTLSDVVSSNSVVTTGGTLTIGGYLGTTSGTVLVGSDTPVTLTASSTLTLNGLTNTLGLTNTNIGSGTLVLSPGALPAIRVNDGQTLAISATVGASLNALPNIISGVTGTSVRFLGGTLNVSGNVSLLYLPTIANLAGNALDLHIGNYVPGNKFVLQMSYDPVAAASLGDPSHLYLGWFDPETNTWKNAIAANSDGGAAARLVSGAYNATTDFNLGTYGVDTANHVVWAVIDHNSTFGVLNSESEPAALTPEPSTVALLILGGCAFLLRRRRPR